MYEFIINEKFEIFAVSETWLTAETQPNLISIPHFNIVRADRVGRGGGVAFYIKKSIQYKVILQKIDEYLEQLWVSIVACGKRYVLGVLYRPPSANVLEMFNQLENSLYEILPHSDTILITGDLNIDLLSTRQSEINKIHHFNNFLESYDLSQLIKDPTRITPTSQTLLDVIITSDTEWISEGSVIKIHGISDHCATVCELNKIRIKDSIKYVTFRDYRNFNETIFLEKFHAINWDQMYNYTDVNTMLLFLNTNLLFVFESCAPIRTVRVTKPPAPWITPVIREMMELRDKAYNRFKKSKSLAHWQYYKTLRNYTKQAIKREKKTYIDTVLKEKNSKRTWNTLRHLHILTDRKNFELPPNLNNLNAINDHFVSTPQLNKNESQIKILAKYKHKMNPSITFKFKPVNSNDVVKCFNSLKSNAVGADLISLKMFNLVSFFLIDHLTFIINHCLKSSTYPEAWKIANVLPFPKIANPLDLSHLRPISILPMLSKVLEKIMHFQISEYVFDNDIIPNIQSGFRQGHSTTTALITVVDDILRAIDNGELSAMVLLDYSKAFDTMDHAVFCSKLEYYGFDKNSVKLLHNYLSGRTQKVIYNSETSNSQPLIQGVPQGSILGPLLFSIYISDFYTVIKNCQIHHYADDTQIYLSYQPQQQNTATLINNDLQNLLDISTVHNLKLNANKSFVIFFGSKQRIDNKLPLDIFINGEALPVKTEVKNLGLWLDSYLRFDKHVNQLCKYSYNILRQLYPHRHIMSSPLKLQLKDLLLRQCLRSRSSFN